MVLELRATDGLGKSDHWFWSFHGIDKMTKRIAPSLSFNPTYKPLIGLVLFGNNHQ